MAILSIAYTLPRIADLELEFRKYPNLLVVLTPLRARLSARTRLGREAFASDGARERIEMLRRLLVASEERRRAGGGWTSFLLRARSALGRGRPT